MISKETLRKKMKLMRDGLSRNDVYERSEAIMQNLLSLPDFFRTDVVHTYVSSKNNEVDTHELIRLLFKQRKKVVVPVADSTTKEMHHSEILSLSELVGGDYKILVPRMIRPVAISAVQSVIVPALAADRRGNRLGYGAGFYDRFLQQISVPTIILAYDFQVLPDIPAEPTDIPVSFIVTETGIIRCRNKMTPAT